MIKNKRSRHFVLFLASALLLSACGTAEKVTGLFADPIILPCPDYFILADAAELVQYREGNGRDLTDVDFEGRMENVRLSCLTRIDKETKVGEMEIQIAFEFSATRGPANTSRTAEFPYFFYVTNLDKKWIRREKSKVAVDFSGNRSKLGFRSDPITIVPPLPLRPYITDKNYLIYAGFLLTEEQLQSNRLRRQQRNN